MTTTKDDETESPSSASLNREGRKKCWAARDIYLKCLDDNRTSSYPSPTDETLEKCGCLSLRQEMAKICPAYWIPHFELKHRNDRVRSIKTIPYPTEEDLASATKATSPMS